MNVRRLRKERGLTQEALAGECGLDTRHVGRIERGQTNPTVELLGRLGAALGVHPREFLIDQEN